MNREQILSVLYDLSLTIGGELDVDSLLRKTLQRLLFHTSFPAGLVLAAQHHTDFGDSALLEKAVGDHQLIAMVGRRLNLPAGLLVDKVALLDDASLLHVFSLSESYTHCLQLPIDEQRCILLLSPVEPAGTLPLTHVFQPILANLAKALLLCTNHQRLTSSLEADRDDARAELAIALAQSERERAFLDSLYETIPDLAWVKDMNGVYLSCNPMFSRLYNASSGDIVGRTDYDFVSKELADFFREKDLAAAAAGKPTINEEWLTFADNGYRGLFETIKTPMRDEYGHLIGVLGMARDITEHRRVQEALQASEAELAQHRVNLERLVEERTKDLALANRRLEQTQFAMDRLGIGIHWVDEGGRFVDVNRVASEMLGYTREEMLALRMSDVDPAMSSGNFAELAAPIRASGRASFDAECLHRDGHLIPVGVSVFYRPAGNQGPAQYISFISDISERKRAECELREATETAEAATRAKSAFLANMSHEIRTPMNAILGSAYLMRRLGVAPQQSDSLSRIESSGKHLLAVIDDILDLSKIEAGKLVLEEAPLDLSRVMADVAEMLAARAREKGLHLAVDTAGLPASLLGDATRLRQSLLNYTNNAIKFTENGEIILRGHLLESDEQSVLVRLEVEDTGIGIDADAMHRLFTPFEQADQSTTRKYGGTGLGLAITRHLALLMGGNSGAESIPGRGSRFWLTARLKRPRVSAVNALSAPAGSEVEAALRQRHAGRLLLLVEDDPINREVAQMLIEDVGLRIDLAEDGVVALEKVRQQDYALVLMDMQMPRMDGVQATQAIRQLPNRQSLPILAMTANAFAEDREQCLAAGMNDFVSKPVNPGLLYEAILRWLD